MQYVESWFSDKYLITTSVGSSTLTETNPNKEKTTTKSRRWCAIVDIPAFGFTSTATAKKHEPRMHLVSRNSLVRYVCMFSVSTVPSNQRATNLIEPLNQGANDLIEPSHHGANDPIEPSNHQANEPRSQWSDRTIEPTIQSNHRTKEPTIQSNHRGKKPTIQWNHRANEPSSQRSNRTIEPRSQRSNRTNEPENQRSIRTTEVTSYVMMPDLIVGDVDRKAWCRCEWRQLWVLIPR